MTEEEALEAWDISLAKCIEECPESLSLIHMLMEHRRQVFSKHKQHLRPAVTWFEDNELTVEWNDNSHYFCIEYVGDTFTWYKHEQGAESSGEDDCKEVSELFLDRIKDFTYEKTSRLHFN